ncbi:hypothetical protein LTR74_005139 [Friedmanniomyces endolithicus]|nr:hypothetical protein LTR74_005139 [Friedmanniomyces endolithicus]
MPRTLPWLAQTAKKPEPKNASSAPPAPKRKRAATPDGDLVDSDLNTTGVSTPQRRARKANARSPSTSPPPAPPDVEFMHEGYTADDIWIMVEDEFHSTAQAYTQHIHHAEYVRLKKLARSRGADTLQAMARPTDGRTAQSTGTKMRLEAEEKARQVRRGLKKMGVGDESEDEDEYMHDPQLAGLMTGSQREAQDLTVLAKARSNTRAAAGFAKSPQKVRVKRQPAEVATRKNESSKTKRPESESRDSDGEDDLDGSSHSKQARKSKLPAVRPSKTSDENVSRSKQQPQTSGFFKRFASTPDEDKPSSKTSSTQASHVLASPTGTIASSSKALPPADAGQDDDSLFLSTARSQATSAFLAKRRAREAAKQKSAAQSDTSKARSTIAVPTFIL